MKTVEDTTLALYDNILLLKNEKRNEINEKTIPEHGVRR